MKVQLFASFVVLSLSGCSSEVDKCVAEWEKANPGPDNGGDYCLPHERDYQTRKCSINASKTKAQERVNTRLLCLRASKS